MNLVLTIESVFLLLIIAAGILSIPILFLSTKNKAANRILALVQLIVVGGLVHNLLLAGGVYEAHPELYFLPLSPRFALGPLLWIYVNRLTGQPLKFTILHLIPAIFIIGFETYAFNLSVNEKWQLWQKIEWYWNHLYFWVYHLQLLAYLLASITLLNRWKAKVENQFSRTEHISLSPVRNLLTATSILLAVGATWRIIQTYTDWDSLIYPSDLIKGLILLGVCWYGVKQAQIVVVLPEPSQPLPIEHQPETIEVDLSIPAVEEKTTEPLNEILLQRIQDTMQTEKLYLNAELTLHQLARHLGQPTKLISSTINRGTNQNFQAFVNSYRVKEVTSRLEAGDQKTLTLLAIAFDSGFNSKATFNRVFREQTGKSPGNYVSN